MSFLKVVFFAVTVFLFTSNISADIKKFNMVFVPASEKGDENDYTNLIKFVNKLTGFEITFIKL